MNKKRLMMLVELLEKLPRKRFDYSTWVGETWGGKPDLSCGTTACALGWATTIPCLRRAGLRLEHRGENQRQVTLPSGESGEWAGAKVFDISDEEALFLFMPNVTGSVERQDDGSYKERFTWSSPPEKATPKQVAKHIRRFIKAKEKELAR